TYGESTILKRRREDDDQEGPSAGPNRGPKDKKKELSRHQLALPLKRQPRVQVDLQQGLNLDNSLPVSLLLQRNLCRPLVRWRKPHFRSLPAAQGDAQSWISDLAKQADARSSFN
nr:hypothetical protein [Tanacetum cinerariifolium]